MELLLTFWILALAAVVAPIAAINAPIKHDGKAHVYYHHHLRPRQAAAADLDPVPSPVVEVEAEAEPNSPVEGLGVIPLEADAIPASSSVVVVVVSSSSILSSFSSSTVVTISSYQFPTTVLQVAVATVCPDTPASSAAFPILSLNLSASAGTGASPFNITVTNTTTTTTGPGPGPGLPIQVNATALLPNGSTTVFLSTLPATATSSSSLGALAEETESGSGSQTRAGRTGMGMGTGPGTEVSEPDATATQLDFSAETARIVMDSQGCQTVYSALTTVWCSTTIPPPAVDMLSVTVSECGQWVTFSSDRLDGARAGCSTSVGVAGGGGGADTVDAQTPTADPAATLISAAAAAATSAPPPGVTGPLAFYAAHWYELVQGRIPKLVQVQECVSSPEQNSESRPTLGMMYCLTSSESWHVVTYTSTSTGTTVASFSGVSFFLLLPLLPRTHRRSHGSWGCFLYRHLSADFLFVFRPACHHHIRPLHRDYHALVRIHNDHYTPGYRFVHRAQSPAW